MRPPLYRPCRLADDTVAEMFIDRVVVPVLLPVAAVATGVWRGIGWLGRRVGGGR
jgi:hypothetical protein